MKRYKLLKDLPFAKAGAIFKEWTGERDGTPEKTLVNENNITTNLWVKDMENFDEWFEEVKKLKNITTLEVWDMSKTLNTRDGSCL